MARRIARTSLLAGLLWLAAGITWLAGEAIAASAFPGYDYATNYISDLGIPDVGPYQGRDIDSPLHVVMNVTFVLQGVLFLAAAVATRLSRRGEAPRSLVVLAVVYAVGMTLVGLVHGSQASADTGIGGLHVIGAALAIIGGNVMAIVAGVSARLPGDRVYRAASIALGTVGLVALVILQVDTRSTAIDILPDGAWERIAVYTVTSWELVTGALLVVSARRRARLPVLAGA